MFMFHVDMSAHTVHVCVSFDSSKSIFVVMETAATVCMYGMCVSRDTPSTEQGSGLVRRTTVRPSA